MTQAERIETIENLLAELKSERDPKTSGLKMKMPRRLGRWLIGFLITGVTSGGAALAEAIRASLNETANDLAKFEAEMDAELGKLRNATVDNRVLITRSHQHLIEVIQADKRGDAPPKEPPVLEKARTQAERIEKERELFPEE